MSPTSGDKTTLALVIHFHQPVGNLDAVVRTATERCYRPFLEVLNDFPDIRMTLHYSGCLLEWLEENEPDVPRMLRDMSERGQIELMTGGFYEPVLAALPERDQIGQIEMLSKHLRDEYLAGAGGGAGGGPHGLWLTERVWEQEVVSSIVEAGVRYTVLDDTMFHSVGITDDELVGPFVTEHDSKPLLVYAGDRQLRYLIPYKRVARVVDYLRSGEPGRLFVYGDDGEKFGEWPDTYERVYGDKWLVSFFEELLGHDDWLELTTLGEHSATAVPRGRVYLPSSSYDEMMRWALPSDARLKLGKAMRTLQKEDPDDLLPFLRGAPWRSFLAKYPEVNQLQKRMVHVSSELAASDPPADAIKELYRAQCNCAYWHGAFGGVYLSFMRGALWHHLLRAEGMQTARETGPAVTALDIDADAIDEVLITAPWGATLVAPHRGGMLVELDDWRTGANVLAVAARHLEAYHLEDEEPQEQSDDDDEMQAIQARVEIDRSSLEFDEHPRGALVDYLDGARITEAYAFEIDQGGRLHMWLERDGLRIEKDVTPTGDELLTSYRITNVGSKKSSWTFASAASVMPLVLGREVEEDVVETTETSWSVGHPEAEVTIAVDVGTGATISSQTVETASATLEGLKTMHQGTEVTMEWPLELERDEVFEVELRWRLVTNDAALTKKERGVSAGV